jgi:hypothetical protein
MTTGSKEEECRAEGSRLEEVEVRLSEAAEVAVEEATVLQWAAECVAWSAVTQLRAEASRLFFSTWM